MSTISDIYKDDPSWEEYFRNIDHIRPKSKKTKLIETFVKLGYTKPVYIMDFSFDELNRIPGVTEMVANILFQFNLRNNGQLSQNIDDLLKQESIVERISSGSSNIDNIFPGGGFETQSIYEIVGRNGQGKTQMCMTLAANTMRMKKQGGLNRSVLWIDSQRDFSIGRFLEITHDITRERMKKKFRYSPITNLIELENILYNAERKMWVRLGTIIIDSLILPISLHYPTDDGYSFNEIPMQEHIILIFNRLRMLAKRYNLMIVFTNTLKRSRGSYLSYYSELNVQNGADLRIQIRKVTKAERQSFNLGLKDILLKASLENSNRIPDREGFFMIDEKGICTPIISKFNNK